MNKSGYFLEYFSKIEDPRHDINKKHLLIDVLFITVCAVISGADSWEGIEDFGVAREDWFKAMLDLPNGIPSHDTFRNIFLFLDPKQFNEAFINWVSDIAKQFPQEIISIDGKTSRRTRGKNKKPLHLVSAWANKNSMVLAQVKTDEKSNEITAIPEILKVLSMKGCLITIDAMGCQKEIVKEIKKREGDYVISLKGNQGKLHEEIKDFFEYALERSFENVVHKKLSSIDKDHGRIEQREFYFINDLEWLDRRKEWAGLKSVGMIVSQRNIDGRVEKEKRLYISSIESDAKLFFQATRKHWGVENSLHWVLDVAFREDLCRKRSGNSAENFSVVRRIVLNLLKKETTLKISIPRKRFRCAIDNTYLAKVLGI